MELQSPRPPTTVRRNPPRRAKLTTSINAPDPSTSSSAADITPFPTEDLLKPDTQPPKKTSSADGSENLKVFLRVRPLEIRPKPAKNSKAKPRGRPQAPSPKGGKSRNNKSCLVVNDSSSVTLSAPLSVFDSKRSKSELYDGFSFVFPPESAQVKKDVIFFLVI